MDQVFADPQVQHLGMAVPVPNPDGSELKLVGPAIALSRTPGAHEADDRAGGRAQ